MKKTLRTYTKRTLAVFMAALMLLTAWVFVAPEKADAVNSGNYKWRVYVYSRNDTGGWNSEQMIVRGKPNNGTGSQTDLLTVNNWKIDFKGERTNTFGKNDQTASQFPTQLYYYYSFGGGWTHREIDADIYLQLYYSGDWHTIAGGTVQSNDWGTNSGSRTWTVSADKYPYVSGAACETEPSNVTIPKSGTATTDFKAYATDQYGVKIASGATGYSSSATITNHSGVTIPKQTTTASADYWKPSVTNDAKMTGNTNTKTLTVKATFGLNNSNNGNRTNTASVEKTFTITDPQYTYSFNANGGETLSPSSITTYYGNSATDAGKTIPSTGKRIGHEFIAMYDTAKTVSYAATKPTTGTTGYTGNLTNSTNLNYTDKTWYAAWWAKDVNVTYLNNDGTVLKTSAAGKYNQKADYTAASAAPANPSYVYAPGASHGTYEYEFDHWEVVEAKQYDTAGNNHQSEYNELVGQLYSTAVLKGDTTFRAIYRIKGSTPTKYTITYKNGTETTSNANFIYKDNGYKTATYPATTDESKTYTYEFLGWAEQVNSNDTVYFQDWDEDTGAYVPQNNAQTPLTDYKVYSSKTWVAVYGRKYIDYTVTFNFVGVSTDETGATVYDASNQIVYTKHYNETIEIPAPESYTGGKLTGTAPTGVTYSNAIGNTYSFSGWSGGTPSATVTASGTFTAQYTATPANYTIKFVDYNGTVLNEGNTSFNHGTSVTSAKQTADANVTQTWRDDDNEYTFTGWAPAYASTATDNVTYTAQYDTASLYTITYMDESGTLATWKGTTAENIPYMPTGITAEPTKDDDEYATDYTFSGWATTEYDRANPVTPAITPTRNMTVPEGGTTVYAQFTRTPTIYTINFIYGTPDDEGVMPDHKQQLEYGQTITLPTDTTRADDDTYKYEFRGWDKTVSETVVGDATYTALYRKSYVYYTVAWYQPDLDSTAQNISINGEQGIYFAPTTEKVRPDETYIYNSLISAPYQAPNTPAKPDDEHAYVLAGWIYKDTTDVLTRADRVVAENHMSTDGLAENRAGKIELVPVFVLRADVKTVTFLDEDGTLIGTQPVPFGTLLKDVPVGTLPAKSATDDEHYTLDGWLLKTGDTFAEDTLADTYEITDDITVKAQFSAKPHEYEVVETTVAPTFFAEGEGEILCEACHKEGTVVLPKLTDTNAPTGRIMVKGNKWTAISDTAAEVLTAGQSTFIINTADTAEVTTYYFNKTTKEIVNTIPEGADAADYQELTYNAAGTGSQTGDIYIHASKTAVDPTTVTGDETEGGWYRCFNYTEYHEQNPGATEANFSDIVSQIADEIEVADGESFIIYVKIVDRADSANTTYISTAPLKYDGTAPVITITDTGFDTTLNPDAEITAAPDTQTKFCTEVTIAVDDGSYYFISKGGEELETVSNKLNEAGEYTITAYDEAGNMSRRVVQIIGSHSPKAVATAATCTEKGSSYDVCRLCEKTLTAPTETPALGHSEKIRIKQPTCIDNGSVTITCRRCGETIATYTSEDDLRAHGYEDLIANGEHTWGDWVVKTAATCSAKGEKNRFCEKCGAEETEELPIDENAHRWSTTVYDRNHPATCTDPGWTYRVCRWNEAHEQKVADIEPTGHIPSGTWVETKAATCTEEGHEVQYCLYHPDIVADERDTDALDHDFSVFVRTVAPYYDDDNNPVQGYTVYQCSRCDETENRDFTDPVANVTVTFVVNGVASEPVTIAKNSTLNTVTKPDTTKAADETYRYTFAGWKKAEKNADNEWTATGDVLKDTFAIAEDVTLIATYDEHFVNYTLTFYKDDGATRHYINGYAHYNEELNVTAPTKDEDATATYTFAGWKKAVKNAEDKWEATGEIVNSIICKGDENYIAVFTATPKTYTVIWADRGGSDYIALKTLTDVAGGSNVSDQAPALPASTRKADSNGHWKVTGWDQEPTNVTSNLVIRPVLVQEAHSYAITNTPADCTNPAKTVYTCACGYSYSIANGKANGHTWTVLERVNPTATTDGYELRECSVCHIQDRVVLDKTGMINLTINVKDSNGNPVSGANVRVYDGNTLVASGVTDGSGKAVVQVPEAKTYRIEIDGNGINSASGTITVDQNGRITGGGVPTVTRPSGHGCDCTCHKSGLWPSIFRFFHKIIKLITGEFRCCPDANY